MNHQTPGNPFPKSHRIQPVLFPVRVSTYHSENHAAKVINWNDRSDRRWLESHMHWAMHNDATVSIRACE